MKRLLILLPVVIGAIFSLSAQISPDHNMVYDKADRLILTQDGNQRAKPDKDGRTGWTLYKYDRLGRELYTSELTLSGTCESMNSYFNDYVVTETFMDENAEMYPVEDTGYSKGWYHVAPMRLLTVNYYDDYRFLELPDDFTQKQLAYTEKEGYGKRYENATGLLTGTRTYLLGDNTQYLTTVYYYDYRGRVVQECQAEKYHSAFIQTDYAYDFIGNVLQRQIAYKLGTVQYNASMFFRTVITENYRYVYDHAGRLIDTYHRMNKHPEVLLAHNEYDEMGRLKSKVQHNGLNTVEYAYNIRSWPTVIADGDFKEELFYCTPRNVVAMYGSPSLYNGNISSATYTTGGTTHTHNYTYDGLNRLTAA